MEKKAIIIFSGYNQRAVVAFLRTIAYHKLSYAIIASNENDPLFYSFYAPAILAVRAQKALDLKDIEACLQRVKKQLPAESYWIAPSTEALNRFLLDNRVFFSSLSIEIPLVDSSLYELVSDKKQFSVCCQKRGISIPSEYPSFDATVIPFVAKPVCYYNSQKNAYPPILVYTKEEKEQFSVNYPVKDFYFQEFVSGQSYYLLYYFSKSGEIYKYSQKNIAQQPEGKSIVAAEPSEIHLSEASLPYEIMLKELNFNGLIMIEVIKSNNIFVMIEANPRFWGPSQLFVDNGINFFEFLLFDYGFLPMKPSINTSCSAKKYFWHGGIVLTQKAGKQVVHHCESTLPSHLEDWIKDDIYRRDDTIAIYNQETTK